MKAFRLVLFMAAACAGTMSLRAGPILIPFSGGPGLGSGSIAPGENYAYNLDSTSSWGAPGVGASIEAFNSTIGDIEDFTITFAGLGSGVTIANLATAGNCGGGSTGGTVFCANITGTYQQWTPVISNGGLTITFTAPGTEILANGDFFFVNIFFSGAEQDTASFTGGWSGVPEPSTVFMAAGGLLGLGLFRWRKNRA